MAELASALRKPVIEENPVPSTDPSTATIRAERPGEEAAVRDVVLRSFADSPVVADLVDALRESDAWLDGLSFVAEWQGELVGHILTTRSLLDAPRRLVDVLVISPLGVIPEQQGKGIGSRLVRHCLDASSARAEPLVFLEGSPDYYPRFGFRPGAELEFRRPSLRIPGAAFQVARLPAYEPWMTGTLVYAEPFWRLDCVGLRDPNA
jgi:putative acetyltransferase